MLLRNHPLISYSGAPSWPPAWTWTGGLDNKHVEGEIGILRDVLPSNIEPADRCSYTSTMEKHHISDAF